MVHYRLFLSETKYVFIHSAFIYLNLCGMWVTDLRTSPCSYPCSDCSLAQDTECCSILPSSDSVDSHNIPSNTVLVYFSHWEFWICWKIATLKVDFKKPHWNTLYHQNCGKSYRLSFLYLLCAPVLVAHPPCWHQCPQLLPKQGKSSRLKWCKYRFPRGRHDSHGYVVCSQ